MSKVLIVIMVASAAVMIFGLVKQKQGMAWGKPLATLAAVIALICALSHIVTSGGPSSLHLPSNPDPSPDPVRNAASRPWC